MTMNNSLFNLSGLQNRTIIIRLPAFVTKSYSSQKDTQKYRPAINRFFKLLQTAVFAFSVLGIGAADRAGSQIIKFREVAVGLKVPGNTINDVSAYGHGVAMADINNDNLPDIYISNAVRYADQLSETLYLSTPDGYLENDKARRVDDPYGWTGSHGIIFVDYDNDGDYDIYNATTDDRNRLYQNDGSAYFKDVTDAAKLPLIRVLFPDFDSQPYGYGTRGVVAFDANNDAFMDLLAVNWGPAESRYDENKKIVIPPQPNEFYLNNGNGAFSTITNSGLTHPPNTNYMGTQGVIAGDIDMDGDQDILIIHRNYTSISQGSQELNGFDPGRQIPNQLMINDGSGKFSDETDARGLFDAWNDANGASFADYDNDGDLDIFIAPKNKAREYVRAYQNNGAGYFEEVTTTLKIRQWGFSTFFLDADNDGDLDIIAPKTRDTTRFYLNSGNGSFEEKTNAGVELYNFDPRGGAVGDIDNDGDLDLYFADANKDIRTDSGNRLFRNELNSSNRWLKITGRGPKGDLGGFGAKIWVFDQGHVEDMSRLAGYREVLNAYGYLCQDDPVQHFGLGQRDSVDVKVKLLDGTVLTMIGVEAKTRVFFSKPNQIAKISGDNQSAPVLQQAAQPLQVRVRDQFSNTVFGAQVIFSSNDPAAQFYPTTVFTDKDGLAKVWYTLGANTAQTVTAFIEAAPASKVTFTITGTDTSISELAVVSGDQQRGQVGYQLPNPLIVRALLGQGAAVNQIIVFQAKDGSGQVNGAARVEVLTDQNGYAQARWTLGAQPGSNQTVEVFVKNKSVLIVRFHAATFGPPAKLVWASPLHFEGRVNTELPDSLVARVTDTADHPLRDVQINFEVTAGGGLVNNQTKLARPTNSAGEAKIKWKLGTQAGVNNQILQVSSINLQNSPTAVTATALAGPAYRLEKLSGDEQVGALSQMLPQPLVAAVVDAFGNAVKGHDVLFTLPQGDGSFSGKAEQTVKTDDSGRAEIFLTLGKEAEYTVKAFAKKDNINLNGSPAVFKLHGRAGAPIAEKSEFTAPPTLIADGQTRGELLVMLKDTFSNPVANQLVQIKASGIAVNLAQPQQPTDDQGKTFAYFTTTIIGQVVFTLMIGDETLLSRSVTCIVGPPTQAVPFGDRQMQTAGEVLPQSISVLVFDALDHPIANHPVRFSIIDGGRILEPQPALTNASGAAAATWQLGSAIGPQYAQANVDGLAEPIFFTAEALPHGSARLSIVSGNMQIASPNQVFADSFIVQLADSMNLPIPNADITFSVQGPANGSFITPPVQKTNRNGQASALFRAGAESGIKTIIAAADEWGNVQFTVLVQEQRSLTFEKLSPDSLSAAPFAEIEVSVRVRDALGRDVAGEPLICALTGGGKLVNEAPYFTSTEGIFTVRWKLGAAGAQTCEVKPLNGAGSAFFTVTVANQAPMFMPPLPRFINLIAGSEAMLVFKAKDAENDAVAYSINGFPDGAAFESRSEAVVRWTPRVDQQGDFAITVTARDIYGAADSARILLQVSADYLYFPIDKRIPAGDTVEIAYGEPFIFTLETPDSMATPTIQWYVESIRCGLGIRFPWTFTKSMYPNPDVLVTAQIADGDRMQVVSWRAHLVIATAVELADFSAKIVGKSVELRWRAAVESNIVGYFIERLESKQVNARRLTPVPIPCSLEKQYVWTDNQVSSGEKREYILLSIDAAGQTRQLATTEALTPLPGQTALAQNYPNPFNPTTTIRYTLSSPAQVRLAVYNLNGKFVKLLAEAFQTAGEHQQIWDGRDENGITAPSGLYYYRLQAGDVTETRKLSLIK